MQEFLLLHSSEYFTIIVSNKNGNLGMIASTVTRGENSFEDACGRNSYISEASVSLRFEFPVTPQDFQKRLTISLMSASAFEKKLGKVNV